MTVTKLELVVMDWAGTAVDFGSVAPIVALEEVFAKQGVTVSRPLLRRSMGLAKKDHIRNVLALPEVVDQWHTLFGAPSGEAEVERLHMEFTPRMMDEVGPSSKLIPGVAAFAETVRGRGMKLGATTGYTRPMLDRLIEGAALQGYAPDISLCPDDVGGGRPHPWMCFKLAIDLRVSSLYAAVKIGDTESDIAEGLNAGMWTVGVTTTGNEVGLSEPEWHALDAGAKQRLKETAATRLLAAGAHYVVDSSCEALPLLDEIEARLANGERP